MTVTNVSKNPAAHTMTITAELDATIERAWQLWADPRQLERWWGPPTYPATFVDHDLAPGGRMSYFMTGPDGDKSRGWWEVIAVDAPRRIELKDGFADDSGTVNDGLPIVGMVVTFEELEGKTVMAVESRFSSLEAMEQMVTMGMEEGMKQAMSQIDALLAE